MNNQKPVEMKQIRAMLGMSQSQFAAYFHINLSTLQMWEQHINNTPPTILYLVKRILELEGRPFVGKNDETPTEVAVNE